MLDLTFSRIFRRCANAANFMCWQVWLSTLVFGLSSFSVTAADSGFVQGDTASITDAEVGSYVVRDGVNYFFNLIRDGHAGLASRIDNTTDTHWVFDIEGPGDSVKERTFTAFRTTKDTGAQNKLRGIGHPLILDSMTPIEKQMYRRTVRSQAALVVGKPYVIDKCLIQAACAGPIINLWRYNWDFSKTDGITYVSNGIPVPADSYRCDGLMEWAYEAALAIVKPIYIISNTYVDIAQGAYKSNLGNLSSAGVSPQDLYAGATSSNTSVRQSTVADIDRPDMSLSQSAPTISIAGNNYSASWGVPYDQSEVSPYGQYAYGWVSQANLNLTRTQLGVLYSTTATSVSNLALPTTFGTYYFVVYAEDNMGHWSNETERYQSPPYVFPAPTISSVPSITSAASQTITIYGSNFTNTSTLVFYDPNNTQWPRSAGFINANTLSYTTGTVPMPGAWKVKVLNGTVESTPFTFYISSASSSTPTTLTGLSINGPATVNENGTGLFTATALFSDGTAPTVSATWSVIGSAASINQSTGQLTAYSVGSDTPMTVTASYSAGGITKTASASVTIVNSGGGGGAQTQELITNAGFESGTAGWTMSGPGVFSTYPHTGSKYAVMGELSNVADTMYQSISIPVNATSATLSYWYNIVSAEIGSTPFDILNVTIQNSSGSLLATVDTKSNVNKEVGAGNPYYRQKTFDLLPYKGQTIRVHFLVTTDSNTLTSFKIDDVSVIATVPASVTLSSLAITGPSSVAEGSTAQYSATAIFSDGTTQQVTGWNANSGYATISSSGYFSAGQVPSDTVVPISISYGGITANKNVTIANVSVAATYSSLFISGPSSINENSSGQFAAVAIFSDGSSQAASPTSWSQNSGVASINQSTGQLSAGSVSSDTTLTVSASYTLGGVQHSTSQNVTIINLQSAQTVSFGAAPTIVVGGAGTVSATATSGLLVNFISMTPSVCTVSGSIVTSVTAGTCTIAADQWGNANYYAAPQITQTITISTTSKISQTIGAISFSPATLAIGGTTTASATATSGLLVSFISLTPSVCTVSGANGSTVTRTSAGTCTIAADQAGDANYNAATQVTQDITGAVIAPGTPTIGNVMGGNAKATVSFTAPTNTGGSTITGYTVTSIPAGGVDTNAGTTALTHTITGLTNGTAYTFTVTATNSVGAGAISLASNSVTPAAFAATGIFSSTGSMSTSRLGHTATLLPSGKVLIVGGDNSANTAPYLNTAELYDPATGTFNLIGNMSTGRSGHTATLLANGKVLITGGMDAWLQDHTLTSAEIFDPATGLFTPTGNMSGKRVWHTATLLANGKVLIAGGANLAAGITTYLNSAEIYDPATGIFTSTGSMNSPRIWFSATLLNSGNVLVAGGAQQDGGTLTSTELFDPGTGVFTYSANFSTPRLTQTATTALPNNKVLFIGGGNFVGGGAWLNSAEIYDAATGTISSAGNLNIARSGASPTLLSDGSVLVAGGYDGAVFLNSAEIYVPGSATSSSISNMNSPRYNHTATKLQNGSVLLVGGQIAQGTVNAITASAELYGVVAFADNFDGTSLQSAYWTPAGVGAVNISGGVANLACQASANTNGKHTFSGNQIIVESRMAGTGGSRDNTIALVDVSTGETIQFGDTTYQGMGLYTYGSGAFNSAQAGNGASVNVYKEYRLTITGTSLTLERGDTLASITETRTVTLGSSIAGRTFYLVIGTGGPVYYCPASFDWVRVMSSANNQVVPATAPGAPTAVSVTVGNAQATASFTAPTSDGGSAITGYTVTSNPAGGVDSNAGTTALTHVITGLTNNTAYTFTVTATNSVGTSAASAASTAVTPSAPVNTCNGLGTVMGAWTRYGTATYDAANNTFTVGDTLFRDPGDTDGDCNPFSVWAGDSLGQDNDVLLYNTPTTGDIDFSWQGCIGSTAISYQFVGLMERNPLFTGLPNSIQLPIVNHHIEFGSRWESSSLQVIVNGAWNPIPNTSPSANGYCGSFRVARVGANWQAYYNGTLVGSGPATSVAVVPGAFSVNSAHTITPAIQMGAITLPSAPAIGTATAGNAQATVIFTAPASNGGSAITGYTVTSLPAGGVDSNAGTTALTHTVTGLTNGTAYTFTITATNSVGTSVASAASNSVTPSAPATGGCAAAGASVGQLIFCDDFSGASLDTTKWLSGGSTVSQSGGILTISEDVTDIYTHVNTVPLDVSKISIRLRHWMSPANNYFFPRVVLRGSTAGIAELVFLKSAYGPDYCNDPAKFNRILLKVWDISLQALQCNVVGNAASDTYYSRWVDTLLSYDSSTGDVTVDLDADGVVDLTYNIPVADRKAVHDVYIDGYGWWTGHQHKLDYVAIGTGTTVGSASQIVSFGAAPTIVVGGTGTVSATATSGLAVSFTSTTPSTCTVSGSTVTGVTAGACTIAADQAGNANYSTATQVTQNITIDKANQSIGTISFSPATLAVGGTTTVSATTTAGLVVGSFGSLTPSVCAFKVAGDVFSVYSTNGPVITGIAAGTCTIFAVHAGNANYNFATQVTQNITVGITGTVLNLVPSWNLVGNSINAPLTVAATFGDATKIQTVWKWIPATSKWAFYTPTMADGGSAYAAGKGYDFLTTINGGEGFWVNAKAAFTAQLPAGTSVGTSYFQDQLDPALNKLVKGWNLIATGDNVTPNVFNQGLSVTPPAIGVIPPNVTTLWAWDSALANWYFYAPSLEANGTLASYITSKNYLDFTAKGKTLDPTTGFWVNKP